jgi:DNA modification methylase
MKNLEDITGTIINGDCIEVMKTIPESSVDLVVTSCPYSVNISYDVYDDNTTLDEYLDFSKKWLEGAFRVLKDDGRIALNVPFEINLKDRGGRVFIVSEIWNVMKEIGYKWFGIIDLEEESPHRSKTTAWGCYDNQTKVMTMEGLKLFKDVNIETDLFATLNVKTNKIEYQKAFDYIEKPFNGELVSIKHRGVDLTITNNHNMVISENGEIVVKPYNEIESNKFVIPRQHLGVEDCLSVDKIVIPPIKYGLRTKKKYRNEESIEIDMNDWLKFMGIFLTDGSFTYDEKRRTYKVSIYQKKENYLTELRDLLERLPFNFEFKENKHEYYTCSKQLTSFLLETKNKNNRTIPDYIFNCSREQKEIFLKWLFYGDGSFTKDNELWKITVCSEIMINQICRLLLETGRMFSLYKYFPKEREYNGKMMRSNYPLTTIQMINKDNTYISNEHIESVEYNDYVYCVSVPNKTLLVEKSGQLMWCGNSWMSPSQPYIYNPKECLILAYKNSPKKLTKGEPQWKGVPTEIKQEDGTIKNKVVYEEQDKKDFMELVFGQWKYFADTKPLTKATFSMDIPTKAIKILTYKNDIVLDPFAGSGTSLVAAEILDRRWIGIELSPNYHKIATERVQSFVEDKKQKKLEFNENPS